MRDDLKLNHEIIETLEDDRIRLSDENREKDEAIAKAKTDRLALIKTSDDRQEDLARTAREAAVTVATQHASDISDIKN